MEKETMADMLQERSRKAWGKVKREIMRSGFKDKLGVTDERLFTLGFMLGFDSCYQDIKANQPEE